MLQRLPHDLQQQTLLWVHCCGLAGRDPEESRVKLVDATHEPAPLGVHLPDSVRIGVVKSPPVPAPRRHLDNPAAPLIQKTPVGGQVVGTREAAGHPYHGHGFVDLDLQRLRELSGGNKPQPDEYRTKLLRPL